MTCRFYCCTFILQARNQVIVQKYDSDAFVTWSLASFSKVIEEQVPMQGQPAKTFRRPTSRRPRAFKQEPMLQKSWRCLRQATHMASGEVSETTVYLCTGSPLPTDIEAIAKALFNEDFVDVFERIGAMQVANGLALVDIVQQLLPCAPLLTGTDSVRVLSCIAVMCVYIPARSMHIHAIKACLHTWERSRSIVLPAELPLTRTLVTY